ncbi:putative ABC transporter permease subunit [Ornithinibacillus halophilus]|uniref:ABC-2 type transport system permease protein n=1 Tax=Ornithinibacillus halophilus TaxID=930117 RepID=A0A1M5HY82_9BACI|nr:hypothetical protein [Ornithinibacillus halophilus]SHG20956.1 ABC-2 type transport system permease protein [Ornithinibacillus halophilus]
MNKTWLVMKTMLKMHYSRAGKKNTELMLLLLAGLMLIPVLFLYINLVGNAVSALYQFLEPLGQASSILGMLFLTLHLLLFIVSIITVLSAFYFAEDIESFIPYPLQPYQLLLGKATTPFIYLYFTVIAIYLPVFFFYGSVSGGSIFYYLFGIILAVLLPVIPFTIAAIILMFIMRFVNIAKNKDRSKVIAGILTLLIIILFNVAIRLNTNTEDVMEKFASFIQKQDGLLSMITAFYPPAYISAKALGDFSLVSILSFVGVLLLTALIFLLFILAGQRFYLKGVLGVNSGNKKNITTSKILTRVKNRNVFTTLILKELRIIFRTPTFFMQCVIQSLFAPIFLFIIMMLDTNSLGFVMDSFDPKKILLVLFLVTLFVFVANATAISSISRDGASWSANLFLPINMKQVFYSKIATAWIINLFTVGLFLGILLFAIKLPIEYTIIWLVIALLTSWFTSALGTYLDFTYPKLNWTDEQEVFKSRMVIFIALLIEFVPFGIIGMIVWKMDAVKGIMPTTIVLLIVLFIAIGVVHYVLMKKLSNGDHLKI